MVILALTFMPMLIALAFCIWTGTRESGVIAP